jgi:hypothetical protein
MSIPEIAYEHRFKVPVYRDNDILLRYEEHVQGTFIHCDVKQWNPQVKRKLSEVWGVLSSFHGGPVYALHDSFDRKHEKFLKLFGFRPLKVLPNDKEIWIWSNNGQSF